MVSEKIIITLLIIAMLLSVISVVMTISLNSNSNDVQGKNYGEISLIVNPNPEAGPSKNSREEGR